MARRLTQDGLRQLREQGLRIFCAEDHFAEPVEACEPGDRNWALVVGHEDQGVSADCVALSDARICVPRREDRHHFVALVGPTQITLWRKASPT
ncbi:unnamed protein product [Effrenium voratum]|uniref:tRNA/rRNA methyltransferase SpoU type domain-containing protein n=1 Tax=Effrenium voratum TaxID=2562239 RepID=A0AA36IDQ8_9DINO|nr:unnamed protein product [Effrenium voratum]